MRLFKYAAKGYHMTQGTIKDLVKLIKSDKVTPTLDINKPEDLNELRRLLEALSHKSPPFMPSTYPSYPTTAPNTETLIGPGYDNWTLCPKCCTYVAHQNYHYC